MIWLFVSYVCLFCIIVYLFVFFFFNDTATTEIYTLSLHDALPILRAPRWQVRPCPLWALRQIHPARFLLARLLLIDRKSTRLNSSHVRISYAVFCLKKKKTHFYLNYSPSIAPPL